MGYYNYHGMIKRRIRNHELIQYEYVDEYHHIHPCLLLYFNDGTIKPIREYRIRSDFIKMGRRNEAKEKAQLSVFFTL